MRFLFRISVLFVVAATAGSAAREPWRYARTDNFEVFSAASEKQTRQLVVQLEQFRASFIATFGLRPVHEPRVTVMLFNSDRLFTPYKPLYKGRPKDVNGYFVGGADEVVIALKTDVDPDVEGDPAETIFHEYVHFLFQTRGLRLPTWLNEGLAEVFSTFRLNGEIFEYGLPKQIYVDLLNVSPLMPMSRLVAVTEASPDYNEEFRAGMFYAQSWALAHYLICGADRTNAARLARFMDALDQDSAAPDNTFRQIFDAEFDHLEQKLRTYLQGGRYYQRRAPVVLKNLAARIAIRPATDFERDFALLNLRWRVHRSGDTSLAALRLAAEYPESPRPHELLAAVAATDGDGQRALDCWRRAADLQTENAFAYVQGARARLLDHGLTVDVDARLPAAEVAQLRLWLDRATMRSPLYDDAMETLAIVEARAPEFRTAVINLIQARVMKMKDPNPTLLALAMIRWRAKDAATANSIVNAVLDAPRARRETKAGARALQA